MALMFPLLMLAVLSYGWVRVTTAENLPSFAIRLMFLMVDGCMTYSILHQVVGDDEEPLSFPLATPRR